MDEIINKDIFIQVKDMSFSYVDGAATLKNITMDIHKGEYIAIIGANGSGKSTLAMLFNGLLLPDKGNVIVNGINTQDEKRTWDIRKTVGMVFQNPENQIIGSTVEEDVAFGPENLGLGSLEMQVLVDNVLERVGMTEYKQQPPHMLSGGQQQKVSIAGVLAMTPACIIFDEATSMLDPESRADLLAMMKELHVEGYTIITITHFMEEALCADKVLVLSEGKVMAYDEPIQVFSSSEQMRAWGLDIPDIMKLADELMEEELLPFASVTDIPSLVALIKQGKETK